MSRTHLSAFAIATVLISGAAQAQKQVPPMFSRPVEACIIPAAQYHKVNHNILWAILRVESNFKPDTVTTNKNGTNDFGMGGMNTIHMPKLAKHGVTPDNIKDPCISTYVTAWHLSKEIARHGNTWYGVAAYHSATPYFNSRYQVMLKNVLIDQGVLPGPKQAVPPLNRQGQSAGTPTRTTTKSAAGKSDEMKARESQISVAGS